MKAAMVIAGDGDVGMMDAVVEMELGIGKRNVVELTDKERREFKEKIRQAYQIVLGESGRVVLEDECIECEKIIGIEEHRENCLYHPNWTEDSLRRR